VKGVLQGSVGYGKIRVYALGWGMFAGENYGKVSFGKGAVVSSVYCR